MPVTPKLADARATKINWQNGDRMIVRHTTPMSSNERGRLRRSCKAFAGGADVRVIVVCVMEIEIDLIRADGRCESLCGTAHIRHQDPGQPAVANVSCSRVELGDGDKIVFRLLGAGAGEAAPRRRIAEQLARWAGDAVEIVDLSAEPKPKHRADATDLRKGRLDTMTPTEVRLEACPNCHEPSWVPDRGCFRCGHTPLIGSSDA